MRILVAAILGGIMTMCAVARGTDTCTAVNVRQVKVGGEIGRRLNAASENNLLAIDVDKDFLAPFVERNRNEGYIGLGKTLDAFARFAAYTGDERVVRRKQQIVNTLLKSQEPDGYLGIMKPEARIGSLWDVHEMSYLVLGLTSDAAFCGERASSDAARKLADYLIARLTATPPPRVGPETLSAIMPFIGLDEAFLYLSNQTGDARYREFVAKDRALADWRMPLVLGRWGKIEGHAYAYLCECLAQVRLSRDVSDRKLWEPTRAALRFLLNGDGLVITGTCGDHECWHDTQTGTTNLGETCTTAYLLRLYDELLRQTGKSLYGDLIERAVYNALFGAQSPDGRRLRYYTPFEAPRVYHDTDTYCCPGNFRRILGELPQMIYYRRGDGVLINLYTASTLTLPLDDGDTLTLRQETDYPNSGRVQLHCELPHPATFALYLRVPRWSKGISVRVNGESPSAEPAKDGTLTIRREWKGGDAVEIEFPMEWRWVKGRRAQAGRVALMRGPQIFTFNPKRNPSLKDQEPRLLTLDPQAVEGPFPDDAVRPGGMSCRVRVWDTGAWYPHVPTREVVLTEFADPDATSTYLHVPNPNDGRFVDDELVGRNDE